MTLRYNGWRNTRVISTTTVLVILLLVTTPVMRRRLFMLHLLQLQPRVLRAEWSACGQFPGAKRANGWYRLTGRSPAGSAVSLTPRGRPSVWFQFHLISGYAVHWF